MAVAQLTQPELDTARRYHRMRGLAVHSERESLRSDWLQRVRAAVTELAPRFPELRAVYLFGSLTRPGFNPAQSYIGLAVKADSVESESAFWSAVERTLKHPCDVRPLTESIRIAVVCDGILLYEREQSIDNE